MRILVDMNLSPDWVAAFAAADIEAAHWSDVGDPKATDTAIVGFARDNGYIIFTHDLDFGTILAITGASGPSVVQVRTQDVLPARLARVVIPVLKENQVALDDGALIVIDEDRARIRILPLSLRP